MDVTWSGFALWVGGWLLATAVTAAVVIAVILPRLRRQHRPPLIDDLVRGTNLDAETFRTINRWVTANPWYAEPDLNMRAQAVHRAVQLFYPELSLEDNLALVTAEMRKRFPERCGGKLN